MFDELFLMSFRSSNGSGMGAAGATSSMLRKVAPQPPDRRSRLARGGPCRQGAGEGEGKQLTYRCATCLSRLRFFLPPKQATEECGSVGCVEAHGGDEATEADDEHGGDEPRVGVRRDATKVGQAHEVAEDVPAGRVFARVGAGGGWGQEAGRHAQAPGARLASRRGRRWRLLPAAARGERRREEPGAQEEVGRVGAEERGVGELRTRSHSAQKGEISRHTALGTGAEAAAGGGVQARCAAPGRQPQAS